MVGILTLASLAACDLMPTAGPTAVQVVGAASRPDTGYALVKLDARVMDILAARTDETLLATFGDRLAGTAFRVGVGDELRITIWEAASGGLFNSTAIDRIPSGSRSVVIPDQTVSRDGTISVPYAGYIPVRGLTLREVETAIVSRLQGRAIDPQVLVNVTKNASNTVTVAGEIVNGALVPIGERGLRILEAAALAGGIRSPVHETFAILTRGRRSVRVPLPDVLKTPRENVFLQPGDILTFVREPQSFTALGATARNAVVTFDAAGISLEEALAKAGGFIDTRADPEGVFLLRYEPMDLAGRVAGAEVLPRKAADGTVPVIYQANMRDIGTLFMARRFMMRNRDIVYVSNAPVSDLQKILVVFQTLLLPAQTFAITRAVAP